MADAITLKRLLERATAMIVEGQFEAADAIMRELAADPQRSLLGPETALGLPRRLHSSQLKLAKARGDLSGKIALQSTLVPPVNLLLPLFEVTASERRKRVAAARVAVPKVLHQIWIGSSPPETTEVWQDYTKRHGWDYQLWNDASLAKIGVEKNPTFKHMLYRGDLPGAVDVARYHVLLKHGGLYLDCDWMPVHDEPFEHVIPMAGLSAIAEETPRLTGVGSPFLNNSVIAAPPEHPVFRQLIDCLPEVVRRLPKGPAWWVTGPLSFTLASRVGPVTVLDAGIAKEMASGGRAEVDTVIDRLKRMNDACFLLGWKPWAVN